MEYSSVSCRVLREHFGINAKENQKVIALAGNPNVGKSTVFNALTGLRQHTGNWPGKTVDNAQGVFTYKNNFFLMVDLPGTYSILARTVEEEIARDFICFGQPDVTIVVLDATSLERNLNLALQVMEITSRVVVCVNLIDEAKKKNISIDYAGLEQELGVPVVPTAARGGIGLEDLKEEVYQVALGFKKVQPRKTRYSPEIEEALAALIPKIQDLGWGQFLNPRWVALRFLEGDEKLIDNIVRHLSLRTGQSMNSEVEIAL
ncbi:MAG: iron transporter FeoB [Peptococcaceae bacterium]|jgi:Fe2+ transport system protein B|nr:iron transporter FeoB [Peptococcaceae bacterium]